MINKFISILFITLSLAQEQIHLALSGKDSSGNSNRYTVSWFTSTNANGWLNYICDKQPTHTLVKSKSIQYLKEYGFHHHATTKELPLNRVSCLYQVGTTGKWSKLHTFNTVLTDLSTSFAISMFGDMGWLGSKERPTMLPFHGLVSNWTAVPTQSRLVKLVNSKKIDLMLMLGDISYADDAYSKNPFVFEYEKVYNGYMNWMQPITSTIPFMTLPGNHEAECHSAVCFLWRKTYRQLGNFTAYNARFKMPSLESNGVLSMWYSFNYGNVHIIMMNTETDFEKAAEENHGSSGTTWPAGHFSKNGTYIQWLKDDLVNASRTYPWIIAVGHRPLSDIPSIFQSILEENQVDMYVCGHKHEYVRYGSFHNMTQIIVGSAGSDEMSYLTDTKSKTKHSVKKHISKVLATGLLHYVNSTCLEWTLIGSETGDILDQVYLIK